MKKLQSIETSEKHFEEFIEKLVIINLLTYDEFKNFIFSGTNPLEELFFGLYRDVPLKTVIQIYKKYYYIYVEPLMELFTEDLSRTGDYDTDGRQFLKLYDEDLKQIEKEDRNEFIEDKYTLNTYISFGMQLLFIQIKHNIRKKELEGINLISTKMALKKLLVDNIKNKQTLDNYNELITEANAQLGIFKLPKSFKKFEKKLSQTILENYKETIDENFEEKCFEALKKVQKDHDELYNEEKKLKTGAEEELTLNVIHNAKKDSKFFLNEKKKKSPLNEFSEKQKIYDLEEIDAEIYKLKKNLGIETEEDYHKKSNKSEIDLNIVEKKIRDSKNEKFQSITNFKEFNNDSDEEKAQDDVNVSPVQRNYELGIFNEEKEKELKKLEIIRDLKVGFKDEIDQEKDNQEEFSLLNYVNLDIFKGYTVNELKKLDVEELYESKVEITSSGASVQNDVKIGDNLYKYADEKSLLSTLSTNLSDQIAERNFQSNYDNITKELDFRDQQRKEKIISALERGQYIDDPFYVILLMTSKNFKRLRESFLKDYFRNGPSEQKTNRKKTLLEKYAFKPGDIFEEMNKDGVFQKYESNEGKHYVRMLSDFVDDVDAEENKEVNLTLMDEEENLALEEEGNEEKFNIYEIQKRLSDPYDDEINVEDSQIEKELGWKKISDNVLKEKNKLIK